MHSVTNCKYNFIMVFFFLDPTGYNSHINNMPYAYTDLLAHNVHNTGVLHTHLFL